MTRLNQDDWYLWRRIATAGWRLAKSPAVYHYRIHPGSHCAELHANRVGYFDLASLAHETITLFVPFSGRRWAWPAMREFLERQTWPHDQVRLVLCDTSDDELFSRELRSWLAKCDYTDCRHYWQTVATAGIADADRHDPDVRRAVQAAMPRIYNRMIRDATTEYLWIVEDDVIPPLDAGERLLRAMDADVASVSGAYRSRFRTGWVAWDKDGAMVENQGEGVVAVGGNGFGCVVLRRSVVGQTVIQHSTPTGDFDPNFYYWLSKTHWKARLDWGVECEHLDGATAISSVLEGQSC